jgi:hypothetical protein
VGRFAVTDDSDDSEDAAADLEPVTNLLLDLLVDAAKKN